MGPPRRNGVRKQSVQYSSDSSAAPQSPLFPRQTTPATSKPQAANAMAASIRHLHNLKVLRKRDPSILSVFDQFSHVAVYKFVDGKWEKEGYEGTMFLYERDSYPPYGYYILNRVGMEDYNIRLYPEDFLQIAGKTTVVQSFPEFTEQRLAAARASAPQHELDNKFSSVWAVPNVESLTKAEKGPAVTIGLWTLDEVAREPLFEVLQRLHSYVRRNLPYPEEFQFGPDRMPPTSSSPAPVPPKANTLNGFSFPQTATNGPNPADSSMTELDKLFSKLAPTPCTTASEVASTAKNAKMTVESLFASMNGSESASDNHSSSASSSISVRSAASPAPSTGISLLDSIFASASSTNVHASGHEQTQATTHTSTIYTPTPSVNGNPQVLSQDVITQLMGLPPSRAASTVSFSSSAISYPSSREGYADNEDESDTGTGRLSEFEDGVSESSTVLDSGAEDIQQSAPGHGHLMPVNFGTTSNHNGYGNTTHGRVQGDVTPRPPLSGFGGSSEVRPTASRSSTATSLPPSLKSVGSASTITNGQRCTSEPRVQPKQKPHQPASSQQATPRRLVPFEPDSELWPYSRNDANAQAQTSQQDSSDDIIELDFNDTSALSDPEAFNKAARNGRGGQHYRNGSSSSGAAAPVNGNTPGKAKEKPNRRRTKKERAAEQARIRQEIEAGWDSPAPAPVRNSSARGSAPAAAYDNVRSDNDKDVDFPAIPPPATPSPCPSPVLAPVVSPRAAITPLSLVGARGGVDSRGSPVGQASHHHPSPMDLRKKIAAINGHAPGAVHDHAPKDHKEVVRESIVSTVAQRSTQPAMEKNEFVREVLTLIHTDKAFVDALYKEYTNRL